MKSKMLILIMLGFYFSGYSQEINKEKKIIDFINDFYTTLYYKKTLNICDAQKFFGIHIIEFEEAIQERKSSREVSAATLSCNSDSFFLKELKSLQLKIAEEQEIEKNKLYSSINICDEGFQDHIILDIRFKDKSVYFSINKYESERRIINNIYLSNGESVFNQFLVDIEKDYLQRFGTIIDKDGYVNIRQGKSVNSKIIGKIYNNQTFYYTPNSENNWWRIETIDKKLKGYMYKNKINLKKCIN